MFRFYSFDGSKSGEEAADVEKSRARHRQWCRNQQPDATLSTCVRDTYAEDGRTRKIPAKWRQQPQVPLSNQLDTDVHMSSKAFDMSTLAETEQQQQQQGGNKALSCQDNQQTIERTANGSLWERRFLNHQTSKSTRQVPTLGQEALWGNPVHYVDQDARHKALYIQPQYYA